MNRKLMAIALLAAGLTAQPLVAAAQAPAQKSAPAAPGKGPGMGPGGMMIDQDKMAEQMKKIQARMDKIRQATEPKECERLLQEHMKTMHETMQSMRGQMMEQRMAMMQMMMEQMMQHEQMMQPALAQ